MLAYKIKIEGNPALDGEYPLELTFTHRDFRTIKQMTGVRANEVQDALSAGDMDVIAAMAAIAMRRFGKQFDPEDIWDTEAGNIKLESDEEVEEPPPSEAQSEPAGTESVEENGSQRPLSTISSNTSTEPYPAT